LGPRAAPEAERDAAELYTLAAAQSAERSCVAAEAAQLRGAPVPPAARSLKLPEALRLKPVRVVGPPGVPKVSSRMTLQSALMLAEAPQLDERD
jgi:hypothetical protein